MAHTLLPHQVESVEYGLSKPYCILGLQMGLGKSLISLEIAERTKSRTLIVCPSYLKLKWKSEIDKFFPGKTVSILEAKEIYFPLDSDYVIISYNSLLKADVLFEWAELVIYDECHFLKTIRAKRTEAAHRLTFENSTKRCLLLTGTPVQNRVYEFYSLIALCNYNPAIVKSKFLERFPTFVDFANHFSYLKEFDMIRGGRRVKVSQWEGLKNEEELKSIWLKDIYISFKSEDVLDLPPYVSIDVPVAWEDMPELLEEYENFKADSPGIGATAKAKAALLKVPHTINYAKNLLDQGVQVVVYSDHVEACQAIAKGLGVVGITGTTKMELRSEMARAFMAKESQVIVATIRSFSTGIDLISSHNMVFNDLSFVPGDMAQAMYRIIRVGQKFRCFFHYIFGTVQDSIIRDKQTAKIEVIRRAT